MSVHRHCKKQTDAPETHDTPLSSIRRSHRASGWKPGDLIKTTNCHGSKPVRQNQLRQAPHACTGTGVVRRHPAAGDGVVSLQLVSHAICPHPKNVLKAGSARKQPPASGLITVLRRQNAHPAVTSSALPRSQRLTATPTIHLCRERRKNLRCRTEKHVTQT